MKRTNFFFSKIAVLSGICLILMCCFIFSYAVYRDKAVPVLMYHGVGTENVKNWGDMLISPEVFEQQIKYLHDHGYKLVSVEEVSERLKMNKDVKKYIAITFDDGYLNNYTYAFPILKKYAATATFYIIPDAVGSTGYMGGPAKYMGDAEIKEMLKAGMRIGSHTMSHSDLTLLQEEQYQNELAESKRLLEQRFGTTVESIAYPYGSYNEKTVSSVKKYGYMEGVTGNTGVNTKDTYTENPMTIYRIGISNTIKDIKDFMYRIEYVKLIGFFQK
ncbi:MAG: polysaccharide deacetylase family protein [Synergistes sp.]|nr:polysaccharide deacetylase family protein [Synergistes sp.]